MDLKDFTEKEQEQIKVLVHCWRTTENLQLVPERNGLWSVLSQRGHTTEQKLFNASAKNLNFTQLQNKKENFLKKNAMREIITGISNKKWTT